MGESVAAEDPRDPTNETSHAGRWRGCLVATIVVGGILTVVWTCLWGAVVTPSGIGYLPFRLPDSLVAISQDDPLAVRWAGQFNLPKAIQYYDQVIIAVEEYHHDHGAYPSELGSLVPHYLAKAPDIYIARGETLTYAPEPEREGAAPFTFYIYGHYPGLALVHGWELKYCPRDLDMCGESDDRTYHPHRINNRWIWVSRSAF